MKYIEYLPEFLREIKEFQILDVAFDPEILEISRANNILPSQAVAESAGEMGLERFEEMLGIPNNGDDIETRRTNIKTKFNSAPFTIRWLKDKLTSLFGIGAFAISVDYKQYHLLVEVSDVFYSSLSALYQDLRENIPANVTLQVIVYADTPMDLYCGMYVQLADVIEIC